MNEKSATVPNKLLLVLCGPTAVGKTALSLEIAERFSCEIVGVDSMQVYRYMDIGTAKPTPVERSRIPHYLIDIVDPDENYTLGRFVKDAEAAVQKIYRHGNIPLLTGGTGLYLKGLLNGVFQQDGDFPERANDAQSQKNNVLKRDLSKRLEEEGSKALHRELAGCDPASAGRIHPNDSQRILRGLEIFYATGIPWSEHLAKQSGNVSLYQPLKIGLTRPREDLYARIDQRVQQMTEEGLLAEVEKLLALGYDKNLKSMQSIGYRHMINFIEGRWSWERTLELLTRDTRHYAKRQYTWFNSDPEIIWHDVREMDKIVHAVDVFLQQNMG